MSNDHWGIRSVMKGHLDTPKCSHPGCCCPSIAGSFCSQMCKVAALEMWQVRCGCEHAFCMSYVDEDVNGVRSSHERSAPGDPKSVEQKEREKLAQSLHDDLTQLLVVARMKLHQHHRRSTEDTINAIDAILERCLMYTRSLMSDLLLPELEDGRLNDPFTGSVIPCANVG